MMNAGDPDKFRVKNLAYVKNTNMTTQRNLDVVSNKFTYCQNVLMNITSHRIRFFIPVIITA